MRKFHLIEKIYNAIISFLQPGNAGFQPAIAFAVPSNTMGAKSTVFAQNLNDPPPPPPPPPGAYQTPPPPPPPGAYQTPPPPPPPQGFGQQPSNLPPYIQPPKSNKGLYIILGIVGGLFVMAVIGFVLYLGIKAFNKDDKDTYTEKKKTEKVDDRNSDDKTDDKDVTKDNDVTKDRTTGRDRSSGSTERGDNKRFPGAKLYFCEDYTDQEVNVSKVFTTGYLTVMVDLRPSGKNIGCRNVKVKLNKIKDEDGVSVTERTVKTVPFTVNKDFDYIYFTNHKDLKFNSPGTYRVYLYDDSGDEVVHGDVKITSR